MKQSLIETFELFYKNFFPIFQKSPYFKYRSLGINNKNKNIVFKRVKGNKYEKNHYFLFNPKKHS